MKHIAKIHNPNSRIHASRFTLHEAGFTLMEIVVATAIFVTSVVLVLSMLNYTLKINRRVQSLRQVAQGTRNFTENITKEIRNGKVDYQNPPDSNCVSTYTADTTSLGLINLAGDHVCFYLSGDQLYLSKNTGSGLITESINPANFSIDPNNFHIYVHPIQDPNQVNTGVQPLVTITAIFIVQLGAADPPITIPYQTTISIDAYDIPHL